MSSSSGFNSAQFTSSNMALVTQSATMRQALMIKQGKSEQLSNIMINLQGKCAVCWMLKGKIVASTSHVRVKDCGDQQGKRIDIDPNWMWVKKHIIYKKKYMYCYKCGLPQDKSVVPNCHKGVVIGKRADCPFEDTVGITLWLIKGTSSLWQMVCNTWQDKGLFVGMTWDQYVEWCSIEMTEGSFYNGLELFIYFAKWRQII